MKYTSQLCNILFDTHLKEDELLKFNIKKFMSYALSAIFLAIFIGSPQKSSAIPHVSVFAADSSQKDEEESNNFNFIKSNEEVKNFIYDGSVLLYGGILLITISCLGIFFTFKPKSNKRKKHRKKSVNINR